MNALLRPMMVPHFTALHARGLKRTHIAVYGAVVAYDAVEYVPTCKEIAELAGISAACEGRDARKALADLVSAGLLRKIRHAPTLNRFVPLGPTLRQAPANDNAEPDHGEKTG
jgi:hypothetical protein